jgi:hypothetical protein
MPVDTGAARSIFSMGLSETTLKEGYVRITYTRVVAYHADADLFHSLVNINNPRSAPGVGKGSPLSIPSCPRRP